MNENSGTARRRREAIRRLLQERTVRSQTELGRLLRAEGLDAAQPTLSRDIHELGLVKGPEGYQLPGASPVPASPEGESSVAGRRLENVLRLIRRYVLSVESAGSLVVLRTPPADAQPVALAIDGGSVEGVVGDARRRRHHLSGHPLRGEGPRDRSPPRRVAPSGGDGPAGPLRAPPSGAGPPPRLGARPLSPRCRRSRHFSPCSSCPSRAQRAIPKVFEGADTEMKNVKRARPRLLGRSRHLHHHPLAAGELRLRGRRRRGRRRPGRRDVRSRGEGVSHRRVRLPSRRREGRVRARLPLPGPQGRRDLRARLPARHVDRAPADRAQAGRDRARHRLRRARARLHRQGQRPGALRAHLPGARAGAADHRAVARVGHRLARGRDRLRGRARHPGAGDEEGPVLARPQPLASLARRRPARGSDVRARSSRCSS